MDGMKYKDINGVDIEEGQTVSFSAYIPHEVTETKLVRTHPKHGGLWAGSVPISLLVDQGLDYRKLKVVKQN